MDDNLGDSSNMPLKYNNTCINLTNMSSVILAAAELATGGHSSGEGSRIPPLSPHGSESPSSSHSSYHTIGIDSEQSDEEDLSKHERVWRYEAVQSRMGTFVLSRQTIIEHLEHVDWGVDAAVESLERAHQRAYTHTRGRRPGDLELPDRVRNIPIGYFRTGEQERRQAADIFFLLVAQLNASHEAGTANPLARSEAVLILDAAGFDFEAALTLIQDREFVTQLLHIRFDKLRTRSGSAQDRQEQDDAALVYYLTLTDRADMHTLQLHLATHGGNFVAAVADWQQNGVDPIHHPQDRGQTQPDIWVGRRHMIEEDGHEMVLRPMPSSQEVHEYNARNLAWRQEPHLFALMTTEIGAAKQELVFREAPADRNHRPYAYIINHDREGLTKNCPNPRKFLIEYVEQGKYRSNGYDVVHSKMKVRTGRYFWSGKGRQNIDNKPMFNINDRACLRHFNGLYRQGYFRPTGIKSRDPGSEWSRAEIARLWQLLAEHYQELLETAIAANKEVKLPFHVPEEKKKEMAREIEKVESEERSGNSVITMARRLRQICKDFVLTFDSSNELLRQANAYDQLRQDQVAHVSQVIKREGELLSEDDILATIEQISGGFLPFEWDTVMPIDAVPPPRQLPSTGLPAVSLVELRAEVDSALQNLATGTRNAFAWRLAAQVIQYYYRSNMEALQTVAVQPVLARMGLSTLDLQALTEEEGLAIFEGFARREQRKQGRGLQERLNSLVATSREALAAVPASMPSGGQIDRDDAQSFGVGLEDEAGGWITDRGLQAGLETLALRNTTVVDMHGARLHFDDPARNPLPTIDMTREQIAVVMHFDNHWTVAIYNTIIRYYHLLDSGPIGLERFRTMAERMDRVVARYFPSHGQANWAPSQSFRQENSRDCGLYVIENIRAMDRGLPFRWINGYEARMRILSEIMRLAGRSQGLTSAPSTVVNDNPLHQDKDSDSDIEGLGFEPGDFS